MVLYDSKGLEVEDASQTYLLLMSDILTLRFGANARNHIDIVLICIQEPQGRVDDAHTEIAALCEDLRVPYGIVLTKTEGNLELEAFARKKFPRAAFVRRVRSLELKIGAVVIPAEGLDGLLDDTKAAISSNEADAATRAANSAGAQLMAKAARSLASSPNSDLAWSGFASQAWRNLGMRGIKGRGAVKWPIMSKNLRQFMKKKLVPEFFKRTLVTHFDDSRLDGELARRLVPSIMRRFADRTRELTDSDVELAFGDALDQLSQNRPYRSRF